MELSSDLVSDRGDLGEVRRVSPKDSMKIVVFGLTSAILHTQEIQYGAWVRCD